MYAKVTAQTPFPDVNALLDRLLGEVRAILGEQFAGMYVYGSLALGDFDPATSDLDFLIVTEDKLPPETVSALKEMHAALVAEGSHWARELEGSYIRRQAVRRHDPADAHYPRIERGGELAVEEHHTDSIIQRFITRKHGLILAGPDPTTLIDPVSSRDLRQAVLDLRWWWELQLTDTSRVEQSGYQAYAILTMCRILYTLEHGDIVSKPTAARWVQRNRCKHSAELVERALAWRPGMPMDHLDETLDFIRFTLARTKQFEDADYSEPSSSAE